MNGSIIDAKSRGGPRVWSLPTLIVLQPVSHVFFLNTINLCGNCANCYITSFTFGVNIQYQRTQTKNRNGVASPRFWATPLCGVAGSQELRYSSDKDDRRWDRALQHRTPVWNHFSLQLKAEQPQICTDSPQNQSERLLWEASNSVATAADRRCRCLTHRSFRGWHRKSLLGASRQYIQKIRLNGYKSIICKGFHVKCKPPPQSGFTVQQPVRPGANPKMCAKKKKKKSAENVCVSVKESIL